MRDFPSTAYLSQASVTGGDSHAIYTSTIIVPMHVGADEGLCHIGEIQVAFVSQLAGTVKREVTLALTLGHQ